MKKKKSAKKWWILLAVIVLVLVGGFMFRKQLALLGFDLFLQDKVEESLNGSYQPIDGKPEVSREVTEPFSTLLLGVDQRDKEVGRSDTMIYSVVRPKDNKVLLISIPRDTYTKIIGYNGDVKTKINHAYAHGGVKMSIDTVEDLLGTKVDHYATVNFQGLKDVVDAMGGVKLPITEDIVNKDPNHEKFRIEGNKPIYNGQEALYYVRYREDSDMNRTMRHRIFLEAMMNRAVELDQIHKIPDLIGIMGKNFTTDMRPSYMIDLAKTMFQNAGAPIISSYMLHGEGQRMDGGWYYIPLEEDIEYVQQLIKNWMDPNAQPSDLKPRQFTIE
ncbi:LCP family protein [Paenibacillus sp. SC116]|uniref:LCP family protein n=1 Tax=Paenibacillus sp. SC116 TaxID=2968986 RepID=UPI00215ABEA7|nr:LCP family protein [Paenibacillus sp. SC116]MCR8844412.1 LCP family protein [Paenibacillus sp. SC116]